MIKDCWKGSKEWMTSKLTEIQEARKKLPVCRDTVGLLREGERAAVNMYDAGALYSEAATKFRAAEEEYKIFMARRRRKVRVKLESIRRSKLKVWEEAPNRTRGPKPTREIKEKEIEDEIVVTIAYRQRREAIIRYKYILDMAEKAIVEPFQTKSMMIMSMKKIVYKGSPD